jgi:hypothetical protein
VKTTIDIPDDIMQRVKIRAVEENRRLKDLIPDLLLRRLDTDPLAVPRELHRVRLPLIEGGHPAPAGEELTAGRIAEILLRQEEEAELAAL